MTWSLPTILTVLRLVAAMLFPLAFLLLPRPYADMVAFSLFVLASATDWLDGYLARAWVQVTRLGAVLDPVADKAMVVIALLLLGVYSSLRSELLLPAALILFREVFVSGLREFPGVAAGTLKVTALAKWKTAAQMVAITVLFAHGVLEHMPAMPVWGMESALIDAALAGDLPDKTGVSWKLASMEWTGRVGLLLLWIAGVLTSITGVDYARRAWPYLKGD